MGDNCLDCTIGEKIVDILKNGSPITDLSNNTYRISLKLT